MKSNASVFLALGLMVIVGSVLRVSGFAPQIAMGLFGAVMIRDKRLAILLPIVSMLFSDLLYEILYRNGLFEYGGFYQGQVINYIFIAAASLTGFWARNRNWGRITAVTIAAPIFYFLLSNFEVWLSGTGLNRPYTFNGLLLSYADGLPFLKTSLVYTVVFSAILFGGYALLERLAFKKQMA